MLAEAAPIYGAQAPVNSFEFNGAGVRVFDRDGAPWFVASDICRILGLENPTEALRGLQEGKKITLSNPEGNPRAGIPHQFTAVSESGLYSLIFKSRKPEAEAFQEWVTGTVLPSIRKTGSYSVNAPKTYAEALRALADASEDIERRKLQSAKEKPMLDFYHAVASSDDTIGLNEAAKLLGLGRNKMMREMRRTGVLTERNIPYQRFLDRQLFRVIESSYTDSKDAVHVTMTTRVFQRGVEFLRRRFAGEANG